ITNTLAATTLSATATLAATLAVCWTVKTAAAQSGTPSAAPLAPVIGGALIGAVPLPQSRPVQRRKSERADEAGLDRNVVSSPHNLPMVSNRPAREYSPQEVRFKLQALEQQAAQGLLSLEEYRELQQRILLGQ